MQSTTREPLDQLGLTNEEAFADAHYYTLTEPSDDALTYPRTVERTEVRALDGTIDRLSLMIQHYRSPEQPLAYYQALFDYSADIGTEPIYRTDRGIFTLITRPTKPSWPGPLIIY